MSRLGSFIEGVDRADVAERVDQGIGSSPFTRWLKSKLTIDSDHSQDGRCVHAELPRLLQHLDPQHKVQQSFRTVRICLGIIKGNPTFFQANR